MQVKVLEEHGLDSALRGMAYSFGDYLYYDESSPTCLRWKIAIKCTKVVPGTVAGSSSGPEKYYQVCIRQRRYKCHNVVYEMFNGKIPQGLLVDHKNRDRTDNRIENLRLITKAENARNANMYKSNKSGTTGVYQKIWITPTTGKENNFWVATWRDLNGKPCSKSFNVNKYGNDLAKDFAINYRKQMIEDLNKQGAGYTANHGE